MLNVKEMKSAVRNRTYSVCLAVALLNFLVLPNIVIANASSCILETEEFYYDLNPIAEKDYWSYEEESKYADFNLNFYLSVCHPLRNIPSGTHCSDGRAGVCVEKLNKNTTLPVTERFIEVVTPNAGRTRSSSLKLTNEGWLEYTYSDGTPCEFHGANANYTTSLNLLCPSHGSEESAGPVLLSNAACYLTFAWLTNAACPLKNEQNRPKTCIDKFINSDEELNLHNLHSETFYKAISAPDEKNYQANICGPITNGPCKGKNATVCDVTDPSNPIVIANNSSMSVKWDGPYFSLNYKDSTINPTGKTVIIKFLCDRLAHNVSLHFLSTNESHMYFAARTSTVCTPQTHECVLKDRKNQVFDLRPLHKKEENWEVLDRREDHRVSIVP